MADKAGDTMRELSGDKGWSSDYVEQPELLSRDEGRRLDAVCGQVTQLQHEQRNMVTNLAHGSAYAGGLIKGLREDVGRLGADQGLLVRKLVDVEEESISRDKELRSKIDHLFKGMKLLQEAVLADE